MPGPNVNARAVITAHNTFTDAVALQPAPLEFGISINYAVGSSGTVTVQRSFDWGVSWEDVEAFTASVQRNGRSDSPKTLYRVGVKTGGFGAGTITVAITQG